MKEINVCISNQVVMGSKCKLVRVWVFLLRSSGSKTQVVFLMKNIIYRLISIISRMRAIPNAYTDRVPCLMTNMTTPSWIDKNACATYPFGHFSSRPILHRNKWSFRVYIIPLRNFVPEWNSPLCHSPLVRPGRPYRSSLKGAVSWKFTKFKKQELPQNWVKQKNIRSKC